MAIGKELFFIYNKKIGVSRRNGLPNGNGKRLFFVIWKLTTVTCQNILNVEVGTFGIFLGFSEFNKKSICYHDNKLDFNKKSI